LGQQGNKCHEASLNIVWMIKSIRVWWMGHVEHVVERDIYIGFGCEILKRKKPGGPSCGWEGNTKMNFTGVGLEIQDWIYQSWNRDN